MKAIFYSGLFSLILFSLSCSKDSNDGSQPSVPSFTDGPTILQGWTIFSYVNSSFTSIRYSPSIIVNGDNSIDAWYTMPGGVDVTALAYFNQISYIHSNDGGKSWSEEKIVVRPTPGSVDRYYVRNPSVIKTGDYYYMAYESRTNGTTTATGSSNRIYVCRSKTPDGPWDKWNSHGWGGVPDSAVISVPLSNIAYYGVGEASLLVKDNLIYFYYSVGNSSSLATKTFRATASATDALWPAHLSVDRDSILDRSAFTNSDRVTVKYNKSANLFYGIGIVNRLTDSSYAQMWKSTDGIHFDPWGKLVLGLKPYAAFIGLSADSLGQINNTITSYLSYSFGASAGSITDADTYFSPVVFK